MSHNPGGVANYSAIQRGVNANTTGEITEGANEGDTVSLVLNDVSAGPGGGPLVAFKGEVVELSSVSGTPEAYTLTYDTLSRTLAAGTDTAVTQTGVDVVQTAPATASYGFTSAQAVALLANANANVADIASLITANTDIIADVLVLRKILAALITDLATAGIVTT